MSITLSDASRRLIFRLGTGDMPDRDPVLAELVEQMSMYPHDTIFFLNVWCFGCVGTFTSGPILISRWEQVVKAVASHFRSPVSDAPCTLSDPR